MENICGFDEYISDFQEMSLPEYRWLAQEMLEKEINEFEVVGNDLSVYMPECISRDGCTYDFRFRTFRNQTGGMELSYIAVY